MEKLEATAKATGDHWRSYAYRKAITALKNHPRELTRVEEARAVRGVGERIADKIAEILETGKLRKADIKDDYVQAVELFSKVCARYVEDLFRGRVGIAAAAIYPKRRICVCVKQ